MQRQKAGYRPPNQACHRLYSAAYRRCLQHRIHQIKRQYRNLRDGQFRLPRLIGILSQGYSIPRDSIYKVWNTKAFKQLDEYIKTHPLEPKPYLDRANHWQNIKLYPEAIADYNKYIELWAYNPSAWMNRGNAHERLKHYDSAMFDYNRTLELKPNDTIANFNKGIFTTYWQNTIRL